MSEETETAPEGCAGLAKYAVGCACPYCQEHPQDVEPGVLVLEPAPATPAEVETVA